MDGQQISVRLLPASGSERRWAGLCLLACLAALVVLSLVNPAEHPWLPACPTEQYVGVLCPGCGSTRATHWLLRIRPDLALRYNPLLVLVGAPLGLLFLLSLGMTAMVGRRPTVRVPAWTGYLVAALLVLYMVVRNVPLRSLEALRPPPAASKDFEQGRVAPPSLDDKPDEVVEPRPWPGARR